MNNPGPPPGACPDEMQQRLSALRARRTSLGLTQEHMAYAAGISVRTLQRYESGAVQRPVKRLVESIEEVLAACAADKARMDD